MNRKQRRAETHIGMVNLKDITWPWQMTIAECATMAEDRMRNNYLQTGHPYHHLTANGAIVEPDPTLEYYLSRLEKEEHSAFPVLKGRAERLAETAKYIQNAVPVNRKYYGHDPFERH